MLTPHHVSLKAEALSSAWDRLIETSGTKRRPRMAARCPPDAHRFVGVSSVAVSGCLSDGNCSVRSASDASSPQVCATGERATSTFPTPLRARYHKYAVE